MTDWMQFAGNAGLIVGLILVGVQIRQNTEIAQMQMVHDSWLATEARHMMMIGENPSPVFAKAIYEPAALTEDDHIVLDHILKAHAMHVLKLARFKELGFELINPVESGSIGGMAYYLDSVYGKAWWAENRDWFDPEAAKAISAVLAARPTDSLQREIQEINNAIANQMAADDS